MKPVNQAARSRPLITAAEYASDMGDLLGLLEANSEVAARRLLRLEGLLWAAVRTNGGTLAIPQSLIRLGRPVRWSIRQCDRTGATILEVGR